MRFLGTTGYYGKLYQIIAIYLTTLLRKVVKFSWVESSQYAFDEIQTILINHSILTAPDFYK